MAVTAVSRELPVHSLESLVQLLGSWAVDRIVAATAVTGLRAPGEQGAGPGPAARQANWAADRVQ
jgi:hypothetical protein